MDQIIISPLQQIHNENGDVFHGIKNDDAGFSGFGEAYFSEIKGGKIKAWKRHEKMICNIIVTSGKV